MHDRSLNIRSVDELCHALEAAPLYQNSSKDGLIALFKELGCNDTDDVRKSASQKVQEDATDREQVKGPESDKLRSTPATSDVEDMTARLDRALRQFQERTNREAKEVPRRIPLTTEARFASLDAKLALLDASQDASLAQAGVPGQRKRHIFVDSSNIYCGFQACLANLNDDFAAASSTAPLVNTPSHKRRKQPVDLAALDRILDRSCGCEAQVKTLVGSSPLLQDWQQASSLGYEVAILARVPVQSALPGSHPGMGSPGRMRTTYKEQGVDELLHLKMHESLLSAQPGTLVLASGDANAAQFSQGSFFKIVLSALGLGWQVEVCSFAEGLSALWAEPNLRELYRDAFRLILLDDFVEELEQT